MAELTNSMGADKLKQIFANKPTVSGQDNMNQPRSGRRRSRQVATVMNTNGPVALLGINRDSLSRSHRSVNLKVRNARDVLKVSEVAKGLNFDQYQSPATKPVRVTSAVGKRAISALR